MPPSAFRSGMFDAVTAFSVFSHLSEESHRQWATELGRVTREGGKVFMTVLEEGFLHQVAGAQSSVAAGEADEFTTMLAMVLPDAERARRDLHNSQFVYAGGGADEDGPRSRTFYGWAIAPRAWVMQVWGHAGFRVETWIPAGQLFEQAMVVLVREPEAGALRQVAVNLRPIEARARAWLRGQRASRAARTRSKT